jgi:putative DNA primase/helicase
VNCPFHVERTPSCYLFDDGHFKCFGCGAHGDAIEYLMRKRGLTFAMACEALGAAPQRKEPAKIDRRRKYEVVMPVPANAPKLNPSLRVPDVGEPQAVWWYKSMQGAHLFAVVRYPVMENGRPKLDEDGKPKKTIRTWCWAYNNENGSIGWACTRPPDHLPLYGLERFAAHEPTAPVILVEGEKTADAVHQYLGGRFIVLTWCGGARNADKREKVDWSPLAGRRVILWPDYDKVGALAMSLIAGHITGSFDGAAVPKVEVVNLEGLEARTEGWDGADGTADDADVIASMTVAPSPDVFARMVQKLPGKLDDKALRDLGLKPPAATDTKQAAEAEKQGPGAGAKGPGNRPTKNGNGDSDDIEANDIAAATAFVEDHHRIVLYCPTWDRWHVWDGQRWRGDDQGTVFRLAEKTALRLARDYLAKGDNARQLANENEAKAKAIWNKSDATAEQRAEARQLEDSVEPLRKIHGKAKAKAEQVQTLKRLKDMLDLAKTRVELVVDASELDADEYLFNTLTGVVDLRNGEIYKHDSKRRITRLAPIEYDPATPPGRLLEVFTNLFQVLDDNGKLDQAATDELAAYAQAVLGNSLQGNNRLERFYVWQGPGGSGKGTLMEAIKEATGDYTMTAEFQSFVRTQGTRVRDDLARLAEARVVFASETEEGEQLAAGVIKSITGRDTITARQLYGSYFEFRPRLTLHLQCNDLPRTNDQDSGLWRRLVLIPCGPQISEDKRDPGLKSWLLDPKTGGKAVLTWLIAGAIRTHSLKHIPEPTVVKAATAAYRVDQDPTKEFFAEALRFASAANHQQTRAAVTDVLRAYTRWCDDNTLSPRLRCSPRTIAQRLEARGCYRQKIRVGNLTPSVWIGVTVPHLVDSEGNSILLVKSDHTPGPDEHEAALVTVPVFRSSASRKTPTRARAPAPPCNDSYLLEEQKNTGTDQNTPPKSAGPSSPADGTNPPEDQPPTDAHGIDLRNL